MKTDESLANAFADYWSVRKAPVKGKTISQVRTIPVGESIKPHLEALPYEQVQNLIDAHE